MSGRPLFFASRPALQLGPLEEQLLREVWSRGHATVRELVDQADIRQAYTTVMTTLDRLYKKGFLNRFSDGRAFRYEPRITAEELQRSAALDGISKLLSSSDNTSLPLSYLVEAISAHDSQLLDELESLIERKRLELKRLRTQPDDARPAEGR